MAIKVLLYIVVTPFIILSLNSLNINHLFKTNKVFEARLFYLFIAISLIYLVTNFIYDFTSLSKIV